ncbi:MAG: type IV secretory system conjugative DNA transfer family protein, partial [Sciscionella sp.]
RFERRRPAYRPPLALSASEAAALLPLPSQAAGTRLVLAEAPARSLPPAAEAPRQGVLVGTGERPGFNDELRIGVEALTQHVHVLGPTGRGKTTLLCNLYLEAARLGLGALYAEPKGDAIEAIRQRIPTQRNDDVVLLDFADEQHPPALNLLACAPGDEDIHAEALVGIFRRLFGRYWGPRSEDILRSAFTTLLTNRQSGRPTPTLADVLNLLTDPAEKARHPVSDPVALGQFWRQWQALSTGQREQALAPVANKLRAFLGRRSLRNIVCQQQAPDFERIIRERKLLLVSLPARTLGDAADLVGSVLIYRLWQAAQRLGPNPARPPFLCLVDEAHRFCRLPGGLAQALAEARGYRLGFLLAHQHLTQLGDQDLAEAVHANTQTKLCFSLPPLDAHRMAGHFTPRLDEDGLSRLGRYRIACRISHDGRQLPAATATTQPLPEATPGHNAAGVGVSGPSRAEVEAAIIARYGCTSEPPPGGRGDPDSPPGDAPSGPPFGPPFDGGPGNSASPHGDKPFGDGELSDQDRSNGSPLPSRRGGGDAAAA